MPSFFVVMTRPGCEDRVRRDLIARSYDVYQPLLSLGRPLLSRVLFVADDGRHYTALSDFPNVVCVVNRGGTPCRMKQSAINFIMRHEDDDGFVKLYPHQLAGGLGDLCLFNPMRAETRSFVFVTSLLQPELVGVAA